MAHIPRHLASGFGQGAELTAAIARTAAGSTIGTAGSSGGRFDGATIQATSGAIVGNVIIFIHNVAGTRRIIGEYKVTEAYEQPSVDVAAPPMKYYQNPPIELASGETIQAGMLKAGTTYHVTAAGGSY